MNRDVSHRHCRPRLDVHGARAPDAFVAVVIVASNSTGAIIRQVPPGSVAAVAGEGEIALPLKSAVDPARWTVDPKTMSLLSRLPQVSDDGPVRRRRRNRQRRKINAARDGAKFEPVDIGGGVAIDGNADSQLAFLIAAFAAQVTNQQTLWRTADNRDVTLSREQMELGVAAIARHRAHLVHKAIEEKSSFSG